MCLSSVFASLISIHALREEGDLRYRLLLLLHPISIHALREEGDFAIPSIRQGVEHFYPRPPRGGRLVFALSLPCVRLISIHALREEGDTIPLNGNAPITDFYPRPPRGGRLWYVFIIIG